MVGYWKVLLLVALLVLCMGQGLGYQRCADGRGVCSSKKSNCRIISPKGCPVNFKCCKLARTDDP